MSELEIQGLVKRFGAELVIDGISFYVKDGEFFVIVGPSGGGKSTLLRIICGLEQPDKGRIMLRRNDITQVEARDRNVGIFFQDYGLYPHMDVYGNIAYGLQVRGMKRVEIERRVKKALEILEIAPLIHHRVTHLSGGEQQRVALARVLAKDADIYLYDEPLSNLDPKLRYQARRDILRIHQAKQKPSVYVTHDLMEAYTMGDRIAVIADKRLQQVGTPEQLMTAPANLFVARFAGTPPMNLLTAQLRLSEGTYLADCDGFTLQIPARWNYYLRRAYKQTEIIVGIKPTSILPEPLFSRMESEPLAVFRAEIISLEPLFTETILHVKVGKGTSLTALYPQTEPLQLRRGQIVTLGIYEEQITLFDPVSEKALRNWLDERSA